MSTAPPIARDRLIGLAGVPAGLVFSMEMTERIPRRASEVEANLEKIIATILKLCDRDIFTWLDSGLKPKRAEIHRAATIVADRLCGSVSDPIVRMLRSEDSSLKSRNGWSLAAMFTRELA